MIGGYYVQVTIKGMTMKLRRHVDNVMNHIGVAVFVKDIIISFII